MARRHRVPVGSKCPTPRFAAKTKRTGLATVKDHVKSGRTHHQCRYRGRSLDPKTTHLEIHRRPCPVLISKRSPKILFLMLIESRQAPLRATTQPNQTKYIYCIHISICVCYIITTMTIIVIIYGIWSQVCHVTCAEPLALDVVPHHLRTS